MTRSALCLLLVVNGIGACGNGDGGLEPEELMTIGSVAGHGLTVAGADLYPFGATT